MCNCVHCGKELTEVVDTTYSNYTSVRVNKGDKTGDIYYCDKCEAHTIDDYLDGVARAWSY